MPARHPDGPPAHAILQFGAWRTAQNRHPWGTNCKIAWAWAVSGVGVGVRRRLRDSAGVQAWAAASRPPARECRAVSEILVPNGPHRALPYQDLHNFQHVGRVRISWEARLSVEPYGCQTGAETPIGFHSGVDNPEAGLGSGVRFAAVGLAGAVVGATVRVESVAGAGRCTWLTGRTPARAAEHRPARHPAAGQGIGPARTSLHPPGHRGRHPGQEAWSAGMAPARRSLHP